MADEFRPFSALSGSVLTLAALFNPASDFIKKIEAEHETKTPTEMANEHEQTALERSVPLSQCEKIVIKGTNFLLCNQR